jgi:hypothetical protein
VPQSSSQEQERKRYFEPLLLTSCVGAIINSLLHYQMFCTYIGDLDTRALAALGVGAGFIALLLEAADAKGVGAAATGVLTSELTGEAMSPPAVEIMDGIARVFADGPLNKLAVLGMVLLRAKEWENADVVTATIDAWLNDMAPEIVSTGIKGTGSEDTAVVGTEWTGGTWDIEATGVNDELLWGNCSDSDAD